ncbi:hypothetical protein CQW23_18568 [Capsicum baccatum]|uniref:DUF4005 domain-containing protein n=1 Tax=Capsicum baccatum TaxID=33114 RepID=A0A2G2W3B3_CAPBA|nr:hypothetical protein CQW23_18568 [Capsicum baccatum]
MGKASKWFKALLGFKKNNDSILSSKNKWSDVKSYRDTDHNYYGVSMLVHRKINVEVDPTYCVDVHSNVVSTSSVRIVKIWNGEERAAIVIQSYFRAYLSRRALRALKGLVKLQALVRGHIVRKQTAEMLRRMQALIRAQSRALAARSHVFQSPPFTAKSTQFLHHGPITPDNFEQIIRARSMKNYQMFMLKANVNVKHRNLFHSSELSYDELQSTASSRCARSRTVPFTPTKGTRSYMSSDPNYMYYTESSKAKARSLSAPKLRAQNDKRYSSKGDCSSSGRLDRIGVPVRGHSEEFNRDLCHIY